jgi:hypothetical protein
VRQIEQLLVVSVRVNRRHLRRTNAKLLVNHFRHRRETVRRTRGIRNHVMRGRVILLFVHAQNDRDVFVLRRRGDDHFLHGTAQMLARVFGLGEDAGRFNYDLSADRLPIDSSRISLRENAKLFVVDLDSVFS